MQPRFVCTAAIEAGATGNAGEMEKDERHEFNVTQCVADFFPISIESLGYWTPASLKTLKTIALKTTTFSETTLNQALRNLSEQLSVKLCEYNAKLILRRIALEYGLAFGDVVSSFDDTMMYY